MEREELQKVFDEKCASGYDRQWSRMTPLRDALHLLIAAVLSGLGADALILYVGARRVPPVRPHPGPVRAASASAADQGGSVKFASSARRSVRSSARANQREPSGPAMILRGSRGSRRFRGTHRPATRVEKNSRPVTK